jgi:predicted GNAT family N-acyltransferase
MPRILVPTTPEELELYYALRFAVLRQPWNQPKGSEKDDLESTSFHALMLDNAGKALAVCRLQKNSSDEGQIRYMGVRTGEQGKGYGKQIMSYMEEVARKEQLQYITLHARENAVAFYKSAGYVLIEKSYLMWNEIQHYLMRKQL